MKKSKNARVARALKAQEPKAVEDAKHALFIRGQKTNEVIMHVMKDLNMLKKPHSIMFSRKNEIRPFEDVSNIEFLCNKNNAALFAIASHSKKRPQNLVMGRMFNSQLLDMLEFGVEQFAPMTAFKNKLMPGGKPCFIFEGAEFEHEQQFITAKSLILDFFRGETVSRINLAGLDRVCVCSIVDSKLLLRHYTTSYHKAGSRLPRIELVPTGPNLDLVVRRSRFAVSTAMGQALRKPKTTEPKRVKNIARDEVFGDKLGRLHVEKQDLGKIQTRKMKGLKAGKRKREGDGEADE
jgi:ribosome production factor 2